MPRGRSTEAGFFLFPNEDEAATSRYLIRNADISGQVEMPDLPITKVRELNIGTYRPDVRVRTSVLAYVPNDRSKFIECEYDLAEIYRALDTDSLLRLSVSRHFTLCLKEGWYLKGKNQETVDYIRRRLFEFQLATTIPFETILRNAFWDLIIGANSFLIYRRDRELSSGKPYTRFDREYEPIAGIFNGDATSFRIRRNRWGEVKAYHQVIHSDVYTTYGEKYFATDDVLHIYHNKKTGMAWGTPFAIPVLDDIRLLRQMEELANLICNKGAFPFYHYKIGTEDMPCIDYENGTSEVTVVNDQIQNKSLEGIMVTPERHEISAVDAKPPITNVIDYIDHFKKRVLAGLFLSPVDAGETDSANKATANQASKGIQYNCKDFQKVMSIKLENLFDELLEEGGFDITPENKVHICFPEIDIETQQIVNNHLLALYQGNAITEDEMRVGMGRDLILTEEEHNQRHLGMVQMPLIELQRQAQASVTEQKTKAQAANRNTPANQHGKKSAAGSRANDMQLIVGEVLADAKDYFGSTFPTSRQNMVNCIEDELKDKLRPLSPSFSLIQAIDKSCSRLYSSQEDTISSYIGLVHKDIITHIQEELSSEEE